jgi:hypothetical protein
MERHIVEIFLGISCLTYKIVCLGVEIDGWKNGRNRKIQFQLDGSPHTIICGY